MSKPIAADAVVPEADEADDVTGRPAIVRRTMSSGAVSPAQGTGTGNSTRSTADGVAEVDAEPAPPAASRKRGRSMEAGSGSFIAASKPVMVVLTGGPCAGKTTALSYLSDQLTRRGCTVLRCVESATLVMSNGVSAPKDASELKPFQVAMLKTTLALEDMFLMWARASVAPGRPCVVLCDRGALDGRSFTTAEVWQEILVDCGHTEANLLARYDLVVHLVTAAVGAELFYEFGKDCASNPARFHDPHHAAIADRETIAAWSSHPRHVIVDNSTDFSSKVSRALKPICAQLGISEPQEATVSVWVAAIERHTIPVSVEVVFLTIIALPSLSSLAQQVVLVKRLQGGSYSYVRREQRSSGVKMVTKERPISEREYHDTLSSAGSECGAPVDQELWCFFFDSRFYTLKSYDAVRRKGVMKLECEVHEGDHMVLPPFVQQVADQLSKSHSVEVSRRLSLKRSETVVSSK